MLKSPASLTVTFKGIVASLDKDDRNEPPQKPSRPSETSEPLLDKILKFAKSRGFLRSQDRS